MSDNVGGTVNLSSLTERTEQTVESIISQAISASAAELVSRLTNAERALYSTAHESGVWKYLEKHRAQWAREP